MRKNLFSPRFVLPALVAALSLGVIGHGIYVTAAEKWTIKDIMKNGHKGDTATVKKAISGQASATEKKQLLEYYQAMAKLQPPEGDADSWKTKTAALIRAAELINKGDPKGTEALKSASNCKACHSVHKGK
ncbi:MAG: hypothetical protein AB1705_23690 [Verrucomicrobiota bacterium]